MSYTRQRRIDPQLQGEEAGPPVVYDSLCVDVSGRDARDWGSNHADVPDAVEHVIQSVIAAGTTFRRPVTFELHSADPEEGRYIYAGYGTRDPSVIVQQVVTTARALLSRDNYYRVRAAADDEVAGTALVVQSVNGVRRGTPAYVVFEHADARPWWQPCVVPVTLGLLAVLAGGLYMAMGLWSVTDAEKDSSPWGAQEQ